jgi:peptide/nickel transport system substrate-binding protein
MQELLNAGPAVVDEQGILHPQLAEAVPTTENGLWKVFPDGRMETTWKLKPGVKWHDGRPFSSDDLLFTINVDRDREVPRASRPLANDAIDSVEAPDPLTLVVYWKRPFIDANKLFSASFPFAMPMPRHILEPAYLEDKTTLMQHPHWTSDYVGVGPYRLREVVRGSHISMEANPDYVLGRPRIDEIEVKVIQDPNALVANVLAGTVEVNIGRGVSFNLDQAVQVRDQWREGRVELGPGAWVPLRGQFVNPSPPIMANPQFKRAMYHAIDREQMVETLLHGLGSVIHTFLAPNQAQYRDIEARVMKYEYDPRRATQMIEGLGFSRGPDGLFQDPSGQRLSVELRTTNVNTLQISAQATVADYWQRIGVGVDQVVVPAQRQNDFEYRSTYPGFELLVGTPHDLDGIGGFHSSKARLPENNFVGSTHSRYMNPELDSYIDRYFVTIPTAERLQLLGQIATHMAENVAVMPLVYTPGAVVIANRIQGAAATKAPETSILWNVHTWDVR